MQIQRHDNFVEPNKRFTATFGFTSFVSKVTCQMWCRSKKVLIRSTKFCYDGINTIQLNFRLGEPSDIRLILVLEIIFHWEVDKLEGLSYNASDYGQYTMLSLIISRITNFFT